MTGLPPAAHDGRASPARGACGSTTATLLPCCCCSKATDNPMIPAPRTRRSYGSPVGESGCAVAMLWFPRDRGRVRPDPEVVQKPDLGAYGLVEIPQMERFVFRMRVGVRVFDPDQKRRHIAQNLRKHVDEGDGAAAADAHRVGAVARGQTGLGHLEYGMVGACLPGFRALFGDDVQPQPPRTGGLQVFDHPLRADFG